MMVLMVHLYVLIILLINNDYKDRLFFVLFFSYYSTFCAAAVVYLRVRTYITCMRFVHFRWKYTIHHLWWLSLEICLDHQLRTPLNTYLGDIITGRTIRIPSSITTTTTVTTITRTDIDTHQAQISLVIQIC